MCARQHSVAVVVCAFVGFALSSCVYYLMAFGKWVALGRNSTEFLHCIPSVGSFFFSRWQDYQILASHIIVFGVCVALLEMAKQAKSIQFTINFQTSSSPLRCLIFLFFSQTLPIQPFLPYHILSSQQMIFSRYWKWQTRLQALASGTFITYT